MSFAYRCVVAAFALTTAISLSAADAASVAFPSFDEVYGVVRSNLTGASAEELNRAAVAGFLSQLQSRVTLVTNGAAASQAEAVPLVSKATALEGAYGFLRVGRVDGGLAKAFRQAYDDLVSTNKLKGLIVDLRFAGGHDYAAAAEAADLFYRTEQPLLQWGETSIRSTTKASAIELPLVVLINRETSGAAEAFAAGLRHAEGHC
ncbi:MAG: S41 family peptidase [Verrucomicrobiota bacterium]